MMIRWKLGGAAALVIVAAGSGCYTYHAVVPAEVAPQERVRVTVSAERSVELAEVFRGEPTRTFSAVYLDGGDELLFSVPLRNPTAGMSAEALHNRVSVPRSHLVSIETRELSKWRTGVVVGGIAGAVAIGAAAVLDGSNAADGGERGEVDSILIPLLSWSLPWGP